MADSKEQQRREWLAQADILTEALPYMRRYTGATLVIKYGGHAMGDPELAKMFARDIVLLKQVGINPIVVHGGGPQIGSMLERLAIESEFVDGLRVTGEETINVVEMVLSGQINKNVVHSICEAGGRGVGLSGKDGGLVRASKIMRKRTDPETGEESLVDLGFVGEPSSVDPTILEVMVESDIIPIVAPIGADEDGQTYNINADTAAGAIAGAVGARRLLMLTDVAGVLDSEGHLIPDMTVDQAEALKQGGTIKGGMIPKVETCISAVQRGVDAAVIIDGRVAHSVLLEIFTEHGSGTLIRRI